jgi:Fe-S cluster assembly protein SufB
VAAHPKPGEQRANRAGGGIVATPEAAILTDNEQLAGINADYEQRYGFHDAENYLYKAPKGLSREIVEKISEFKSEPEWMRGFRLKALDHFLARKQPTWGSPMLAELDYDNIRYFVRASEAPSRSWDDVPEDVKRTFDRWGFPRRSGSSCPGSARSTSQRSCTTRSMRTSRSRA